MSVVFCPPLPYWSETLFNSTDNNFLSVVTYWCNDGYAFKGYTSKPGNETVLSSMCLASKTWYPAILDCHCTYMYFCQSKQAVRLGGRHNMPPPLLTLTFDLWNLKSVWESHVTWGTPVQSFVFLGLLVFELEPMYATSDGQTDGRTDDGRR